MLVRIFDTHTSNDMICLNGEWVKNHSEVEVIRPFRAEEYRLGENEQKYWIRFYNGHVATATETELSDSKCLKECIIGDHCITLSEHKLHRYSDEKEYLAEVTTVVDGVNGYPGCVEYKNKNGETCVLGGLRSNNLELVKRRYYQLRKLAKENPVVPTEQKMKLCEV